MGDPTWVGRIGPSRRAASCTPPPSPPVSTWMLAACQRIHVSVGFDRQRMKRRELGGRLIGAGGADGEETWKWNGYGDGGSRTNGGQAAEDGRHGAGEAAGEQREKFRGRRSALVYRPEDEERRPSAGSSQMANGVFFPNGTGGARLGPTAPADYLIRRSKKSENSINHTAKGKEVGRNGEKIMPLSHYTLLASYSLRSKLYIILANLDT
ncbi:hypothetical protein GQ55_3G165700 [Panicum hallii var. hallii]|uniref:Uncharacterized protein n=1 Tax=Panicum hallii var. hallii TaxID=1504633 RepID=A0A2T7EA61_9POAL|nr:hypothetical protein GQ55_3G165700 [Panicum hallii var. hallii]